MTDAAEDDYITTREASAILRLSHNQALVVLQEHDCDRRDINPQFAKWRRADVVAVAELRDGPVKPQRVEPMDDRRGDLCDTNGARRLKERIEAYWRQRGATVAVELVESGFVVQMRTRRVDVRSDMVDGWPREWAK